MFDNASSVIAMLGIAVVTSLLGLAIGWLLGRNHAATQGQDEDSAALAQLQSEGASLKDRLDRANAAVVQYRTQTEGLQEQLTFVKEQLGQVQDEARQRLRREAERVQIEAEKKREEQAKALQEQSKVLSALAPVQKNLDTLQQKVTQIEEGRKHEMGALDQQLKGLGEQQLRLGRETSSLASALRNNKVRGAWGEAQLRNIVESAGLLEHVDFDTQVVVQDGEGKVYRPDMVVHLPGGKSIPIDAKAPYSNYQRACEIPDTATEDELNRRSELLKAHARDLREHVRALGDKAYWNAFKTAPDFVIAFIPNESLLQAALESDPALMDDAFNRKVALTSPVTLWAVLKSVAFAWQQQSLSDDAKKLFDLSRELYGRMHTLGSHANALGKAISNSVKAYNKFAVTLESRVLVTGRKLEKLDGSKVIEEVSPIEPDRADIRELTAAELADDERSTADSASDSSAGSTEESDE
ncbi:MAG: DNA recombination protein RmuC [Bifidobacterium sp.]|uniref:DNA recombination protein RmuC n=1 Tax=Bifidobacterium sp. TaxID=41200 RepID=UPI0039EAA8D7